MIPKIIHHTGPTDKSKWHPLWHRCRESWIQNFDDFEHRFWTDEDIDNLIHTHYPQYAKMYDAFPVHIMKIDFVRFAIMHHCGGIYADMDYFCYRNFYDELTHPVYLVENPYGNDPIENSLMCSEAKHSFWICCMDIVHERFKRTKERSPQFFSHVKDISLDKLYGLEQRPYLVFYIAGTNLLSTAYREFGMYSNDVKTLSGLYYNNHDMSYDPSYRVRHVHTGLWGSENQELIESLSLSHETFRNMSVDMYDFYTDYSNGNYLKDSYTLDWSKNDCETTLFGLNTSYVYF